MHIAQFLHSLALTPNVEIIIPWLAGRVAQPFAAFAKAGEVNSLDESLDIFPELLCASPSIATQSPPRFPLQ
jgi:hypothetical protein